MNSVASTYSPTGSTSLDALHEVGEATEQWAAIFNQGDPAAIASLYAEDGVLWGTVATALLTGQPAIHDYFARACVPGALPHVQLQQQHVRVMGDVAVNSGAYLFHVIEQGREKELPARFSMVWRKTAQGWRLVDHHSSARPLI
ncbi:MAG: SgcJ/EcaC family oxidoreductase [Oxalobacteraceae bacterium]